MTDQPSTPPSRVGLDGDDAILLTHLCGVLPSLRDLAEHLGGRVLGDHPPAHLIVDVQGRRDLAVRLRLLADHLAPPTVPDSAGRRSARHPPGGTTRLLLRPSAPPPEVLFRPTPRCAR